MSRITFVNFHYHSLLRLASRGQVCYQLCWTCVLLLAFCLSASYGILYEFKLANCE